MNYVALACATTASSHTVVPSVTVHAGGNGERFSSAPTVVELPYATSISSDWDDGEMYVARRALAFDDDDDGGMVKEKCAVIAVPPGAAGLAPVLPPEPPPQPAPNAAKKTNASTRRAFKTACSFAVGGRPHFFAAFIRSPAAG